MSRKTRGPPRRLSSVLATVYPGTEVRPSFLPGLSLPDKPHLILHRLLGSLIYIFPHILFSLLIKGLLHLFYCLWPIPVFSLIYHTYFPPNHLLSNQIPGISQINKYLVSLHFTHIGQKLRTMNVFSSLKLP